jgi:hypothetical protein
LNADSETASFYCKNILNYVANSGPGGDINQMDARYFDYDGMPDSGPFNDMFTYSDRVEEIKTALHISKDGSFSKLNSTVS